MAKFILVSLLFLSLSAQADLFDFVSGGEGSDSRINSLIEKMKKLKMKSFTVQENRLIVRGKRCRHHKNSSVSEN